jgi:DNA-binding NarL/FixJ family response regulator
MAGRILPGMRLLLVDDHALFRAGLRLLLPDVDARVEMDEAANCAEALALVGRNAYDLILLDMRMSGLAGLDALTALREAAPASLVVVVSGEDDPRFVCQAIKDGAMGYIPKSSSPEVMTRALKLVLAGGTYVPPNALEDAPDNLQVLTARQIDVLKLLVRGKQNKEIARELGITNSTVKAHIAEMGGRLAARNRVAIVSAAVRLGLRVV